MRVASHVMTACTLFILYACGDSGGAGTIVPSEGGDDGGLASGDASGATDASGTTDALSSANPNIPANGTLSIAATCPSRTPCGGELAGTWRYVGGCVEQPTLATVCSEAVIKSSGTVSGTITFTAASVTAGSVTLSYDSDMELSAEIPTSCTCPDKLFGKTCTTSGATCRCQGSPSSKPRGGSGYTVSGTTVSIAGGSSGPTIYDYCVDGSTLWLRHTKPTYPELAVTRLER